LAAAHRARFIHRDLKFANLQVCWPRGDANSDDVRLVWSACPRGRRRWLPTTLRLGRIVDLARLDRDSFPVLRSTERLRFLHAYLRDLGGPAADRRWKSIARKVLAANARFLPPRPKRSRPQRKQSPLAISQEGSQSSGETRVATKRPRNRKRKEAK
jgi:hypothetical protein